MAASVPRCSAVGYSKSLGVLICNISYLSVQWLAAFPSVCFCIFICAYISDCLLETDLVKSLETIGKKALCLLYWLDFQALYEVNDLDKHLFYTLK